MRSLSDVVVLLNTDSLTGQCKCSAVKLYRTVLRAWQGESIHAVMRVAY